MAVTAQGSNTMTATGGGVEDTLLDVAVAGTFTLHVDTDNMVAGDVRRASHLPDRPHRRHAQGRLLRPLRRRAAADDLIKISVPISNELTDSGALRFTLEQSGAGTDKAFPWKVLEVR